MGFPDFGKKNKGGKKDYSTQLPTDKRVIRSLKSTKKPNPKTT